MQQLGQIDALGKERPPLKEAKRKKLSQRHKQLERERGYEQLLHLCDLGEYDAAQHLAQKHPNWEYEIIEGEVVEVLQEG
ncbi:MAG: hypothetical protein SW833_05085 [Cyanobacteriota bacterium]|nr:hypothetical protein [Cyanobacteriota bacterium]